MVQEWYKEKDIENIINNMEYLSEQVKQKLENEQKIKEMSTAGKSIEKDFKDAVQKFNLLTNLFAKIIIIHSAFEIVHIEAAHVTGFVFASSI